MFQDDIDVLILPSLPTIYTREQVRQDPISTNSLLGYYHNFCNPLDLCALAIPTGEAVSVQNEEGDRVNMPSGVTLFKPAWQDSSLVILAKQFSRYLDTIESPMMGFSGTFYGR